MYRRYRPYSEYYYQDGPEYYDVDRYRRRPYREQRPMPPFGHEEHYAKYKDHGPHPYVVNIEEATVKNDAYRTALWTGDYLQLTLMCIAAGDDIGLEVHHDHDQFIRIEEGEGLVKMGNKKDQLDFQRKVYDDYAIFIPAGKWHNLINTGKKPLKLYSIYAPPEHPHGTVHRTKSDAMKHHHHH
ncbi:mannose-6-phosphate isomerase-like protein (cupin superfamily) [Natranaerovirga hydrolytica]|uniref:Mannose-6-phosphate isomerase-like protein (Cupin superfamily) n=1 Tax=Natranaerovirga hydrolytica TaxID=680378 RepID=A0A4R1MDW3_9FIRM|nr:cupin domain-containing protein [Natranaerovirga hydrolytica]TCK88043.1 mannose-6-phosphate isomerase-like protein (cupin superfamily) [Natranaerovirga hydrolytica]